MQQNGMKADDRLRIWRFGRVEFNERELTLKLAGQPVEIERKPLLVLRHLLHRAGEVVTKDALVRAVWPGRIVTDWALAKSIGRLRDALGDREQALVRTHHGFGYRLVAPVEVEALDGAPSVLAQPVPEPPPAAVQLSSIPALREAERRPITLLSCGLVNAAELAATLDPEALRDWLVDYRKRAREIGERYDAHTAHSAHAAGEGLLMYFGYPQARDDDAERAVRCACEMLATFRQPPGAMAPHALRMGVHSGSMVIGEL